MLKTIQGDLLRHLGSAFTNANEAQQQGFVYDLIAQHKQDATFDPQSDAARIVENHLKRLAYHDSSFPTVAFERALNNPTVVSKGNGAYYPPDRTIYSRKDTEYVLSDFGGDFSGAEPEFHLAR